MSSYNQYGGHKPDPNHPGYSPEVEEDIKKYYESIEIFEKQRELERQKQKQEEKKSLPKLKGYGTNEQIAKTLKRIQEKTSYEEFAKDYPHGELPNIFNIQGKVTEYYDNLNPDRHLVEKNETPSSHGQPEPPGPRVQQPENNTKQSNPTILSKMRGIFSKKGGNRKSKKSKKSKKGKKSRKARKSRRKTKRRRGRR